MHENPWMEGTVNEDNYKIQALDANDALRELHSDAVQKRLRQRSH